MSIFWDHKARKPQVWVAPFFIVLAILVFLAIYLYGDFKASEKERLAPNAAEGSK